MFEVIENIEEVPSELREFYEAVEGDDGVHRFQLQKDKLATTLSARERLKEFRDNNIALKKKLSEFEEKSQELTELEELRKFKQQMEDKKRINDGDINNLIAERLEERTTKLRKEYDAIISERTTEAERFRQAYESELMNSAIKSEAARAGIAATAIDDVMLRAKSSFKIIDGKPIPVDNKGDPLFGKDGVMTVSEWMKELASTAPHLFKPSSGAGAQGNQGIGKSRVRSRSDLKTSKEKAAFIGEHGMDTYLGLPES